MRLGGQPAQRQRQPGPKESCAGGLERDGQGLLQDVPARITTVHQDREGGRRIEVRSGRVVRPARSPPRPQATMPPSELAGPCHRRPCEVLRQPHPADKAAQLPAPRQDGMDEEIESTPLSGSDSEEDQEWQAPAGPTEVALADTARSRPREGFAVEGIALLCGQRCPNSQREAQHQDDSPPEVREHTSRFGRRGLREETRPGPARSRRGAAAPERAQGAPWEQFTDLGAPEGDARGVES